MLAWVIFHDLFGLYAVVSLWDVLLCCLGCVVGLLHERTMVNIGFLAQASMSRLGDITIASPRLFYASYRSGDQPYFERANVSLRWRESCV